MDLNYLAAQPVELGGVPRSRLLLKDVYGVCASQFHRWFVITAPTSLLASVVLLMADQRIRAIYGSIPLAELLHHPEVIAEATAFRYGSYFIGWFLGSFALAAIATVLSGRDVSGGEEAWRSDSYQRAREHFGPLLMAALLTFCAFLAGMAGIEFILSAVIRVVGWRHFSRFSTGAYLVGYVVVASIVSWFGMAIPLILSDDIGAWTALKRSVKLSNGYEGFLFLLVIESLVGSYVAWYAVHYGLTFLLPAQLRYTVWYGWLVYFVSVLAAAAVEPPMFIGFSLLASNEHAGSSSLPGAQQAAQID
ncbi:MAG: hypothetical protein ACLPW4_09165 [Candidatus Sulfotelmatobacter sp.]